MANSQEQQVFFEKITEFKNLKDISYLDALLLYCEETELEMAVACELINSALKIKIEEDARLLNLLKKQKSLF